MPATRLNWPFQCLMASSDAITPRRNSTSNGGSPTVAFESIDGPPPHVFDRMVDVLDSEFVKLTRIKGLAEWKVIWKHCLRNAAIAPVTFFAIIAGVLMTGSVVTESVFSWPGTGLLVVDAVRARDFQVVQAVVIVFAGIFILTNLMVDILYAYLDPRIRLR